MLIKGLVWYLLMIGCVTESNFSTVCYGSPGLGCTEHELICSEPLVISITNITFGYRQGCSPVATCVNTTCCKEETGDCFTPYNQTLLSQLQQTCIGLSTCTLKILTDTSSPCSTGFYSYNTIKYQCTLRTPHFSTLQSTTETRSPMTSSNEAYVNTIISSDSSINTQYSTTFKIGSTATGSAADTKNESDTDVGGIVGGIVAVILVIGIVAVVIFFIKRRKTVKKPPKNMDVNQNGSNRRYQADTKLPRTPATPVYYELEKSTTNTSRPNSAKPTPGDNYDYIGGVKNSTGNDNYNHIGISGVTSDDVYHHLKGPNSNASSVPDSNYNHIGSFSTVDDNYQHIGDNRTRIITDDTYNHIDGHDNTGHCHQVVTDGTYNHIGGDHNEIVGNDDYHHIGSGNTQ